MAAEIVAAGGAAHAQPGAEVQPLGVAAHERLREHHQTRALPGGLGRQIGELLKGARGVETDGGRLDDGGAQQAGVIGHGRGTLAPAPGTGKRRGPGDQAVRPGALRQS